MIRQRPIELLAPAKNLECGIEAINHGADAVYIGAPRFGARAAAGNSLEDIAALVQHAHVYNARIYVTVNTILRDEELKDTEAMIWDLYRAGVDALIIQDMGITRLNLPPIPLHASTQMDNRTVQKVKFLADAGFRQNRIAENQEDGKQEKQTVDKPHDQRRRILQCCLKRHPSQRHKWQKDDPAVVAKRHLVLFIRVLHG